jgi:hypothetical protein
MAERMVLVSIVKISRAFSDNAFGERRQADSGTSNDSNKGVGLAVEVNV